MTSVWPNSPFAPFRSALLRSAPFRSVPFRSVPLRSAHSGLLHYGVAVVLGESDSYPATRFGFPGNDELGHGIFDIFLERPL